MANDHFQSAEIFHVLGQGWYVDISSDIKGPFALRDHAERYLAALQGVIDREESIDAGQRPINNPSVVTHPNYVGPDRRIRHRRSIDDRRTRIRFESLKKPRRSERERRKISEDRIAFSLFGI